MLARIRPRLTYANLMSSIAVFVVLGGGAYATIDRKIKTADLGKRVVTTPKLAQQSVGTGKLKQQAVATPKVKPQAIGVGKLKEPAVSEAKVFDDAISTEKIAGLAVTTEKLDGEAVTTGKMADQAVTGPKLAGITVVEQQQGIAANGTLNSFGPNCPAGTRVISGGYRASSFLIHPVVSTINVPTNGWRAAFRNGSGNPQGVVVEANCLAG